MMLYIVFVRKRNKEMFTKNITQEYCMKVNEKNKYKIFVCLSFAISIMFWVAAMITRGETLSIYFSCDPTNSYMDYFNMLSNIEGLNPYYANANYPALAFVIWRFLYRMVPWTESNSDGFFLRDAMAAEVGFILFLIFCIVMIWELVKYCSRDMKIYNILFPISLIISGPLLFTIERGNIIILSFIFSFIFVLLYDSEKKWVRYFGYFSLALAAGIKIYPALFGLLVVSKKRYKESLHLIIIGIIVFVLPFFAFDGVDSFLTMIKGIFISSSDSLALGFGYNFSFSNLVRMLFGLSGKYVEAIPMFLYVIPIVLCTLIYILNKEIWKKLFALTMFMIWIPSFSYTYVLIFMIIPLVLFIKEEKSSLDYVYSVFFAIIMGTWCLPKINNVNYLNGEEFKFYLTYGTLIVNLILVLFSIFLLIEGVRNIVLKKRNNNE